MVDRIVSTTCKNPCCSEPISPIKRRNNTKGVSEYCSRECYYQWSPGMDEVYRKILRLKDVRVEVKDPWQFMQKVMQEVMAKFSTWTARAAMMQIKRQTFIRWCKHFKVEGD